jgi:hypothetical protein
MRFKAVDYGWPVSALLLVLSTGMYSYRREKKQAYEMTTVAVHTSVYAPIRRTAKSMCTIQLDIILLLFMKIKSCAYMYVCMCACMYACKFVYVRMHTYVYMYVCLYG